MPNYSRRDFLESSMLAAALAAAGPAARAIANEREANQRSSANEKLGVAIVGAGIRGTVHGDEFSRRKDAEVLYVVDPDEAVGQRQAETIAGKQSRKPNFVRDMRKAFEDPSVDVVSIASPNHWHALAAVWAMQAGKDVYVEKPVSHNVAEGRRIVEAARKLGRICQTGTQCRSMGGTIEAIEYVRAGKIGEVKLARGLCYNPRGSIGAKGNYSVPAEVDYDLWCGPAPMGPVTRPQFHYDWHWQWPYGNGDLGNQGIHQMDIARWGLGIDGLSKRVLSYGGRVGYEDAGETPNTQVVMHEFDDATITFEVRGLKTEPFKHASVGVIFHGTDGYVALSSYTGGAAFDPQGKVVRTFQAGGDHFGNFLSAVRSRKTDDLAADILEGHLSSALCHTGNISFRCGTKADLAEIEAKVQAWKSHDDALDTFRRFTSHLKANGITLADADVICGAELNMDPQHEKFIGNERADLMLTREYREPYLLPTVEQL